MHISRFKQQRGLTLIELMVSLLIGSIIMIGMLSLMFTLVKNSRQVLGVGRLDHALSRVMNAVSADIRRAGYWQAADTSSTNPFMDATTNITVNGSNDCVLMAYDADSDGALPSISSSVDDERYGYRLISGGIIQYRPPGASFSCSAATGNWTNLTDPNVVNITNLAFTKNTDVIGSGATAMTLRTITVALTGQWVGDSSYSKTLTQTVKVYNDKYSP